MSKPRNYATKYVSDPHLNDVINDDNGRSTFMLDTIPKGCFREIRLMQGDRCLFVVSVGKFGVRYEMMQQGEDIGCFTLWDDEDSYE